MDWFSSEDHHVAAPTSVWARVAVRDWTPEGWAAYLERLTPRRLVYHMVTWRLLAADAPELAGELEAACDEVRAVLLRRERPVTV